MHAGGEHGERKGMKGAESVRERRFILKGTFSSGISRVKNERGKSGAGESGGDKQCEEQVQRRLKRRKRNGGQSRGEIRKTDRCSAKSALN